MRAYMCLLRCGRRRRALLSKYIRSAEVVAYEDLGTEAIRRLVVEDFTSIVINDVYGNDLYEEGRRKYASVDA